MTTPPPIVSQRPKVVGWFRIYAGFMFLTYLAIVVFSLVFFVGSPEGSRAHRDSDLAVGFAFAGVGLALLTAFLYALSEPPTPKMWIYDLVLICLGMTSACLLPFCIPLLIYWIKPDTRRYFGRTSDDANSRFPEGAQQP